MTEPATSALTVETRQAIADLVVRYATGIDTRDWHLLRSCFTDDCQVDYGDVGRWQGGDAVTAWMRATHEPLGHTLHRITNTAVRREGEAVCARSYVDAIVLGPGNQGGAQAAGFYEDVVVESGAVWRIALRTYTIVGIQPIAP